MRPLFILAAGIVIVALVLSLQILGSSKEDFSTYNAQWDGCSRLQDFSASPENRQVFSAFSLNDLGEKDRGVLVVLNPDNGVSVTQSDIANIQAFVQKGGSLLLADDFGNANALLDGLALGHTVRFNQSLLVDEMRNWAGSAFPIISVSAPSKVTADVHRIDFNYGTTLDVNSTSQPANAQVLAKSGPSSNLTAAPQNVEASQNGTGAKTGGLPVLMSFDYGDGKIMLLSDPSVFANGMLEKGDNAQLYVNIIANLTNGDPTAPIIFDESHRMQQPVLAVAYSEMMSSDAQKYVFVLGATGFFVLGIIATKRRRTTGPRRADVGEVPLDEKTVLGLIAERHPRWRPLLLKELFSSLRLPRQRRRP